MSEVIIITIIFIVSISLYPLNERNLNNYIEKQYGIINDYIETDGSYVYSYNNQNGEKCTLVFNRNFWVKDRFKVGENTNDKKFEISNQYEYLEILNED